MSLGRHVDQSSSLVLVIPRRHMIKWTSSWYNWKIVQNDIKPIQTTIPSSSPEKKKKSKDWRSWKSHWWRDLDILGLIDGHHPFTWQSCFYVIETALENRAERKKSSFFFTQGFLPIRLKFNGSSHIWLVSSNLTSLQFSWANAVTCNWQLPTELDLFIFLVDI